MPPRTCLTGSVVSSARLGQWGMTHYMYAPKDDAKHRALWRVPYTSVEEGKVLVLLRSVCSISQLQRPVSSSSSTSFFFSCS